MDAPNISELLLSDMIMSNLSDLLHTFTVQGDWGFYLLRVNKYFKAASVTLLVLEAFSTLPDEVALVWTSDFSALNVLFFLNKYWPFAEEIIDQIMAFGVTSNLHLCMIHWGVLSWTYLAGTLCSEAILLVRTGAIWGWSKYIILLLGGGVASILLFCFYVVYTSNIHVQFPPESMMRMTGCIAADTEVWPAFVGMCLGEIAIFTLTFMKWYQERLAIPGATRSNLLTVMYHDGALAYLVVKAVWIANLLMTVLAPVELSTSLMMPLRIVHSTVCTRVLLNIRKFAAARRRGGTSLEQSRAWDLAAQSCPFPGEDRHDPPTHEDQPIPPAPRPMMISP